MLIVAIFCSVPVYLYLQNLSQSAGLQDLGNPLTLSSAAGDYYGSAAQVYVPASSDVCVDFEFLGFDPSSSLAQFGIVTGVTQAAYPRLDPWFRKGYSLLLVIRSAVGLSSIRIAVPAAALRADPASSTCAEGNGARYIRGSGYRTLQSIFLLGQPRAFPQDWYELRDYVGVYLCSPKQVLDQCATGNQNETVRSPQAPASLVPAIVMTTRAEDYTTEAERDTSVSGPELMVTVKRPLHVLVYTYWIAAMPFVLIMGLFIAYARGREVHGVDRKHPGFYEIAFGVAATLIAILPLRTVLVPSTLPSLTRVDIFFSMEITLLVGFALAWVLVWTKPKPKRRSRPEADAKEGAGGGDGRPEPILPGSGEGR